MRAVKFACVIFWLPSSLLRDLKGHENFLIAVVSSLFALLCKYATHGLASAHR
jgi:hypothetical protein